MQRELFNAVWPTPALDRFDIRDTSDPTPVQ